MKIPITIYEEIKTYEDIQLLRGHYEVVWRDIRGVNTAFKVTVI